MADRIGLDIGSHSIKIVGLKMASRGPFLTALGIKEISRKKNEEDIQALIETLRSLLKEFPLKIQRVSLTVSGRGVNLIRLPLPSMPRVELLEAIRWEIKDRLPFSIETARIDFHILDEFVEEGVKKLDLMVVVCPTDLIHRTLSVAEGAGLQPVHLDVAPFALWNAFALQEQTEREEVVALIDLGSEKTGIHLFKDGGLQFSREVSPGGKDITHAIMEGLGHEVDPGSLHEEDEKIKQTVGIRLESDDSETLGGVLRSIDQTRSENESPPPSTSLWMRPVLERLVTEIGRSLDYYRSQFNVERVNRVLLTGGGANLKNMAAYLSRELHLPVEKFSPITKIPFDANRIDVSLVDQRGSDFTVALGLALPEPKRIEFLPVRKSLWSRVHLHRRGLIPILIPFLIFLGFLGIILKMNGEVATLQKNFDAKIEQVKDVETLRTKLTLLKEKEEKMKQDLSLLPASSTLSIPYQEILREVGQAVPNNVALTLFEIQPKGRSFKKGVPSQKPQGEEPPKDGQKELHLAGVAFGSDPSCLTALAQIIEGLEKSPLFRNAKLISADENRQYNQPGAEFEITCDLDHHHHSRSSTVNPQDPSSEKGATGGITEEGARALREGKR
jgi:type IV pilus assembly protein PilM